MKWRKHIIDIDLSMWTILRDVSLQQLEQILNLVIHCCIYKMRDINNVVYVSGEK